jgi:hypothetical protein
VNEKRDWKKDLLPDVDKPLEVLREGASIGILIRLR